MKIRRDSSGVHLFERSTGFNVLLDEIRVARSERAAAPRHLAIALTNACDLSCPYCYAPKHRATLDAERVLSWLKEAAYGECLGVGFGGGEPTVHQRFAYLCQRTATETDLAVSFTTHGHRLTRALIQQLAGYVHFVRVSVDGTDSLYERNRGRPYDRLLQQIELAARLAPIGLNVVVNDETVRQLDQIVLLAQEAGAMEVLLLPERPTASRPGVSEQARLRLQDWVRINRNKIRLAISDFDADIAPTADPFGEQPSIERYAHVDASGYVRPTSYSRHGVPIGDGLFLDAYARLLLKGGTGEDLVRPRL